MKTAKHKLQKKAIPYGEYFDTSRHFTSGAIIHNAISNVLRNAHAARARLPSAALMLH